MNDFSSSTALHTSYTLHANCVLSHSLHTLLHVLMERFSIECRKTKPKQLRWPITTGANSAMNQSEFKANTCNRRQARENTCERGTIGLGFTSHWLRKGREFYQPITARSNAKTKAKTQLRSTLNRKPL